MAKNKWLNKWGETAKYRHSGEPTNSKCDACAKKIWQRISMAHTISHGHGYYANDLSKTIPESVVAWNGKSQKWNIVCPECFDKIEAGELKIPIKKKRKKAA